MIDCNMATPTVAVGMILFITAVISFIYVIFSVLSPFVRFYILKQVKVGDIFTSNSLDNTQIKVTKIESGKVHYRYILVGGKECKDGYEWFWSIYDFFLVFKKVRNVN